MQASQELLDTATETAKAIAMYRGRGYVENIIGPTESDPSWSFHFLPADEGDQLRYLFWYQTGILTVTRFVRMPDDELQGTLVLSRAGVFQMGIAVCEAILGTTFIPIRTRKQMNQIVRSAQTDATLQFKVGIKYLVETGMIDLPKMDDASRWEAIVDAAHSEVDGVVGIFETARMLGVPYDAFNVYDDVYYEKANELMAMSIGEDA